ncbi:MAG: hypothetical protein D8M57_11005 [Candidatus Scalindua sp. AMX11]|nr:MAG: hypothetical protein DWQ00_16050 [Candidatus Scalindua sp.]TDE64844.1 MAG: hypothetical protein D8M57_11005 [Candidatus Scalindua sp. AMX11]GJQ60668.1 MAG: hypothetical protein SCALA701_34690 [Candidatus Scalindua sp.]
MNKPEPGRELSLNSENIAILEKRARFTIIKLILCAEIEIMSQTLALMIMIRLGNKIYGNLSIDRF